MCDRRRRDIFTTRNNTLIWLSHLDVSRTKWGDTVVNLLQQSASSLPMMVQHIQVGQCDVIQNL